MNHEVDGSVIYREEGYERRIRLGWEGKIKGSSFVMLILRYLSDSQKKMVSRLVLARAAVKKVP